MFDYLEIEYQLSKCPMCDESFDNFEHLPRNLVSCAHTICSECLQEILNTSPTIFGMRNLPRCPIDKKLLPNQDLSLFPVMSMIEELIEVDICNKHGMEKTFVCLKEKITTCKLCSPDHLRQRHKVQSLNLLEKKADYYRKEIKGMIDEAKVWREKIRKTIVQNETQFVEIIRKNLIKGEETNQILSEVNYYFEFHKTRLNALFGDESKLVEFLQEDESKLQKLKITNLLSARYIPSWGKEDDLEKIQKEIQKNFDLLVESLSFDIQKLLCFDPLKPVINLCGEKEYCDIKPFDSMSHFTIKTRLNFQIVDNSLKITSHPYSQNLLIEVHKWKEANNLTLTLAEKISEEDVVLLSYVWQKITTGNPSSLVFELASGSVSSELCSALVEYNTKFTSVDINIQGYDIVRNPEIILLIQIIVAKAKNIKRFVLRALSARFPVFTFEVFNLSKLEEIELYLFKAEVPEGSIENFFVFMPNLQKVTLWLQETKITDKIINTFTEKTLNTSRCLEHFFLNLDLNPITDESVKSIAVSLERFKNLKVLVVSLNATKITDKTLRLFGQTLSTHSITLTKLQLGFSNNPITDEGLCSMFRSLPNIVHFSLIVNGPCITDNTIESFVQNTLTTNQSLRHLRLRVFESKITEATIIKLLENIKNMDYLSLDLHSSGIIHKNISSLLQNAISKINSVKKFTLNINNSFVDFQEDFNFASK